MNLTIFSSNEDAKWASHTLFTALCCSWVKSHCHVYYFMNNDCSFCAGAAGISDGV